MSRKISGDKLDIEMLMGLNHYDYRKDFEVLKQKEKGNDFNEKKQELFLLSKK